MKASVTRKNVRRRTRRTPSNRKKPNYRLLFRCFLISALVSGVASFALNAPFLNVREVKITGVRLCDEAAVRGFAKDSLGKNILLVRKLPVASRIRSLTEVADVNINRDLPDKVRITVRERKAAAVIAVGRKHWLIQPDGLIFHEVSGPVKGLPVIEITERESIKIGRMARSEGALCALEALRCCRREKLALSKISIDRSGDMCLNMGSGFFVRFGPPDDIAEKMSLLRSALVYKPSIAEKALYIDLSCPSAPVWMPKAGVRAAS